MIEDGAVDSTRARGAHARGFALLGLLVFLALAGLSLLTFTQSAASARQRALEADLLWVGEQYRAAIESYHRASPGPTKQLPSELADLVRDPRFAQPVRHLRRLYPDPMAPDRPWGILRLQGEIIGVYSQAPGEPFRKTGFDRGLEFFAGAHAYSDWRFLWVPGPQSQADRPSRPPPASSSPVSRSPAQSN